MWLARGNPSRNNGKIIGKYEKQMGNPWKSHSLWRFE
jgi:hypothetical protein